MREQIEFGLGDLCLAMETIMCNAKSRRCKLIIVLLIFMLQFASCFAKESHKAHERPSFGDFVQQTVSILKKSHTTHLDKIKTLIHQVQLHFFPPNLDFRSRDEKSDEQGVVDEMKEAAEKSFETSKDAVEESAKSAAKAMEEAVDKVKENLKDKDKNKNKNQNSHDEL